MISDINLNIDIDKLSLDEIYNLIGIFDVEIYQTSNAKAKAKTTQAKDILLNQLIAYEDIWSRLILKATELINK